MGQLGAGPNCRSACASAWLLVEQGCGGYCGEERLGGYRNEEIWVGDDVVGGVEASEGWRKGGGGCGGVWEAERERERERMEGVVGLNGSLKVLRGREWATLGFNSILLHSCSLH